MAKEIYVGVNNKARKVKKAYVGIDGIAHKVLKVYVGDGNNKARLCWVSECQHPSFNVNYFWADGCEYCKATATCTECGYQEFETDHYPEFRVYEEPTCTEDGKGDYHAYFSNELFEDNYSCPDWHTIEALGHDMGDWEIIDERYCLRHCLRNGCSVSEQKTHDIDYSLNPTIYYSDTSAEISWSIPLDTNYCELDGNYVEGMSGSVDTPGTHYIYAECECPNCGYVWSIKDTVYVNQAPVPEFDIEEVGWTEDGQEYAVTVNMPSGNCDDATMYATMTHPETGVTLGGGVTSSGSPDTAFTFVVQYQGHHITIHWTSSAYDSAGNYAALDNEGDYEYALPLG